MSDIKKLTPEQVEKLERAYEHHGVNEKRFKWETVDNVVGNISAIMNFVSKLRQVGDEYNLSFKNQTVTKPNPDVKTEKQLLREMIAYAKKYPGNINGEKYINVLGGHSYYKEKRKNKVDISGNLCGIKEELTALLINNKEKNEKNIAQYGNSSDAYKVTEKLKTLWSNKEVLSDPRNPLYDQKLIDKFNVAYNGETVSKMKDGVMVQERKEGLAEMIKNLKLTNEGKVPSKLISKILQLEWMLVPKRLKNIGGIDFEKRKKNAKGVNDRILKSEHFKKWMQNEQNRPKTKKKNTNANAKLVGDIETIIARKQGKQNILDNLTERGEFNFDDGAFA